MNNKEDKTSKLPPLDLKEGEVISIKDTPKEFQEELKRMLESGELTISCY